MWTRGHQRLPAWMASATGDLQVNPDARKREITSSVGPPMSRTCVVRNGRNPHSGAGRTGFERRHQGGGSMCSAGAAVYPEDGCRRAAPLASAERNRKKAIT